MSRCLFLIAALLSSAACSSADEMERDVGVDSEASASNAQTAPGETAEASAGSIEEETEQYQFAYSWPAEASAIPALARELEKRADEALATLTEEAATDFAAAAGEEWEARPHSASTEWKVVADLPDWLSLSGDLANYSGGAHGNYTKLSLVWDKREGRALQGSELFNSPQGLGRALGERLCAALNAQRAERRGEPVGEGSDEMFDQCPGVDEATVLVGSSNGRTFDRIGIYFGPYVAGAYAEGDYELDFPVTASVLDAVKPQYAEAFSLGSRK